MNTAMHDYFDFPAWDVVGSGFDLVLYDAVLRVPIGDFPAGCVFQQAMLLFSRREMILLDADHNEHKFALGLTIGGEVK